MVARGAMREDRGPHVDSSPGILGRAVRSR